MGAIQHIRLNKVEVKLADTDDPVAQKVSWDPLKPGGSNFKTHNFVVTPTHMAVKKSIGGLLFALVFAIPGALAVFVGMPALLLKGEWFGGVFMLVWGAIFGGVGAVMLFGGKPLTFDKRAGVYFRGKQYDHRQQLPRDIQGRLADVHALQLLDERIRSNSSKGGSSTYSSYELNLVFADGERVNVLDHGKQAAVVDAAQELAGFLNVPIWQAVY